MIAAVGGRRRRAGVGPGARRVRRHHHLRRQHHRPHPDAAAGGLPRSSSRNPDVAIALSLVLLAVSLVRDRVAARPLVAALMSPRRADARELAARRRSTSTSTSRSGAGEVVALLGPNGAGKTTVLRALAGLQPIDAGRIVDRRAGASTSPATGAFVRARAAAGRRRVPGLPAVPPPDACSRTSPSGPARGARQGRRPGRRPRDWLDRVGLGELAGVEAAAPSPGGQAQRVALARALATDPRPAAARRAARRARRRHPHDGAARPAPPPRRLRRGDRARHPRRARRHRPRRPGRHPRGRARSPRPAPSPRSRPGPARATSPTSSA